MLGVVLSQIRYSARVGAECHEVPLVWSRCFLNGSPTLKLSTALLNVASSADSQGEQICAMNLNKLSELFRGIFFFYLNISNLGQFTME